MMFYAIATLIGNSVGENTFRKTRVDNSEPAHNKPLDHRPCLPWQRTGAVRTTANLSSMSMQLYQVRYFLALARTLNFTRAAEQCNVTQPALTKAVQKLEQELGGALIHRERHLTQLTELGKMILPTLEKIFAAAEAVRLQAQGYQK